VTAQMRTDGENDYVFLMNFGNKESAVTLDNFDYTDLLTGEKAPKEIQLPVYGLKILKRKAKQNS